MNEPLTRHLQHLPDTAPSDALWQRIAEARRRQLRRQRGAVAGGAAACMLLAVATLVPRMTASPAPSPALAEAVPSPIPATQSTQPDALQRIDRELQLAYARNADDAELAALWTVRRDLARTHSAATQPVGI